jgi:hypothetical protein
VLHLLHRHLLLHLLHDQLLLMQLQPVHQALLQLQRCSCCSCVLLVLVRC